MTTTQVPAAQLIEDDTCYPRTRVNDHFIGELARALASGATLPPIIADRASMRIVDGFHRRRAHVKTFGEGTTVPVELHDYPDEQALFRDAVARNSRHGLRFDRLDQVRIVLRLQELKMPDSEISILLHLPEPEVRKLEIRIVHDSSGEPVPQKHGFEHLRGQQLTDGQLSVMKSVRSGNVRRNCVELVKLLEEDLVDMSDDSVREHIERLARAISVAMDKWRGEGKQAKAN